MKFIENVIGKIRPDNRTLILTTNAQSIHYIDTLLHPKCKILTLDNLVTQEVGVNIFANLELTLSLFQSYCNIVGGQRDFQAFIKWGGALLHDFDIVDRCLINVDDLFNNLISQKQLSSSFYDLPLEQQNIITNFWDSFKVKRLSTHQQNFIGFWNLLLPLYKDFTKQLVKSKSMYIGLAYRLYCESIDRHITSLKKKYDTFIIIGFYKTYQSDTKILDNIKENFHVELYCQDIPNNLSATNVTCYTSISSTQQVLKTIELIKQYNNDKSTTTAVIVTTRQLLIQLLSFIPPEIEITSSLNRPIELSKIYEILIQYIEYYNGNVRFNTLPIQNDLLRDTNMSIVDYCNNVIELIQKTVSKHEDIEIIQCVKHQLDKLINSDVNIYFLKSILQNIQIPLAHNNNAHVFILALQDTSNLDFDHIILLGASDNNMTSKVNTSTIPYNLRRGFNLPTYDTLYYDLTKYYFYKLFNCTTTFDIIYDGKDVSRFVYQLQYLYRHPIHYNDISTPPRITTTKILPLFSQQCDIKVTTPSMINKFIKCPYMFYLSNFIKRDKNKSINIGTVIHKVLQCLYPHPMMVNIDYYNDINVRGIIHMACQQLDITLGEIKLYEMLINDMVSNVIAKDKEYVPFEIIGTEYKVSHIFDDITINGIIDRVDKKGDIVRVIDYKTGTPYIDNDKIQVLIYAVIIKMMYNYTVRPCIFYTLYDLIVDIPFNGEVMLSLKQKVINIVKDMNSNNKTQIKRSCQFCAYKDFCLLDQ